MAQYRVHYEESVGIQEFMLVSTDDGNPSYGLLGGLVGVSADAITDVELVSP